MPTKKKRHTCHKCGRKLVNDKIEIIRVALNPGGHGKYKCLDKKDCDKTIKERNKIAEIKNKKKY